MPTMRERVAERYPSLLALLNQPEIGKLLTSAVQNNWSSGVFQSKFMASRWFRSQSEAQRRWWVTAYTDPGEARTQRATYGANLQQIAEGIGLRLTTPQLKYMTESFLSRGLAADSPYVLNNLMAFAKRTGLGKLGAGAFKTTQRDIRNLGVSQWFREPPAAETEKWATWITLGRKTIEDFNAASAYTASHRFPHMAAEIRAGRTVAEIAGPMIEAYAREMDWDAAGLMSKMHTNTQFAGLLGIRDPKTNKMRMPTEYEARTMARQRGDWWGTTGGRQADAGMSQALLAAFGKRKSVT
jgi:hypothetical protein